MKDIKSAQKHFIKTFQTIRKQTEDLCNTLEKEDYVIQSIDDVSPPKWHLAHTTWFFETFILTKFYENYKIFDTSFPYLFNSYYQTLGHPYPRIQRGLLSRPTVQTIYAYRQYVDKHIVSFLHKIPKNIASNIYDLLTLGIHHEQQHQELLLMDIKHNFSIDPNFPIYRVIKTNKLSTTPSITSLEFIAMKGGIIDIGHQGKTFCFDNELPRHPYFLKPYCIANRLITNGEYAEFMKAGGYQHAQWWLSDGWDCVQKNHWQAPLYWHWIDNEWYLFTLSGLQKLNPHEPVSHVSYYEADAYARWKGCRLPTEIEWEHYAENTPTDLTISNFLESGIFHPQSAIKHNGKTQQLLGDLWEWTASPYVPYPGYQSLNGALGEYNGKFMSNQMVLRGGSCVTPRSHIRISYRNFFQHDKRWQFSGIRLAKNL